MKRKCGDHGNATMRSKIEFSCRWGFQYPNHACWCHYPKWQTHLRAPTKNCMASLFPMKIQGRAHVVKLILDVLPQINEQALNRKTMSQPVADVIAGELVNTVYNVMRWCRNRGRICWRYLPYRKSNVMARWVDGKFLCGPRQSQLAPNLRNVQRGTCLSALHRKTTTKKHQDSCPLAFET